MTGPVIAAAAAIAGVLAAGAWLKWAVLPVRVGYAFGRYIERRRIRRGKCVREADFVTVTRALADALRVLDEHGLIERGQPGCETTIRGGQAGP